MPQAANVISGNLRLLRTFAGVLLCPPGKIRMRAILKESMANYISLESLIKVDFRKKYELPFFLIPQAKIAKMTMHHSGKQMN